MKFFLSLLSLFIAFIFSCSKPANNKKTISGYSFGTSFSIQFEKNNDENNVKNKID